MHSTALICLICIESVTQSLAEQTARVLVKLSLVWNLKCPITQPMTTNGSLLLMITCYDDATMKSSLSFGIPSLSPRRFACQTDAFAIAFCLQSKLYCSGLACSLNNKEGFPYFSSHQHPTSAPLIEESPHPINEDFACNSTQ